MQKLSIVIPTYNRREKLLRQLHAIFEQPESKNVEVTVLDNHSDYDCENVVFSEFPKEQYSYLRVITHPYNIGGNMNISLSFYYATGDWLWMMSDDDVVRNDSLKTVFQDIRNHQDDIVVKYSLSELSGCSYDNVTIQSLNGLVDYFEKRHLLLGNLIFISTGIFNVKRLNSIMGQIIEYGYDSMSAINPMFFGLDKKLGTVFFSSNKVIDRGRPDDKVDQGWSMNYHYITGRTVALLDYPFESDGKTVLRLLSLCKDFRLSQTMKSLVALHDLHKMKIFHERTFRFFYKGRRRIKAELVYYFYYWCSFFRIYRR